MLPAPARDDAQAFNAKVRRLADSPRARRLDALEKLYKGEHRSDLPSFWDLEVPLHERAPCVQSSIAETGGARLVNLVFGEGRFPTLAVGASEWGVEFADAERQRLTALVAAVAKATTLRLVMSAALEQGLMLGSLCVVASVERGRLRARLYSAKHCEPEFAEDGETVAALEIRYRHDRHDPATGRPVTCWYRRRIDAQTDTTWDVEARADGYEPDWGPGKVVTHALGFCPVRWHRNRPDVSDCDPTDGTALFAGLEDEIAALDMAMSQRHRNGRINGDPQVVVSGPDAQLGDAPMGEQGRMNDPARGSWFSQIYDGAKRWIGSGGGPRGGAVKKAPNTVWRLKEGADAKMLESTGAGATILTQDADALRRTILDARGIVIASPEQVAANASAALMHELFAPMVAVAAIYREEYGQLLADVVNLLLRVAATTAARGGFVALRGLREALPALARCVVPVADDAGRVAPLWVGLPLELTWGPYFAPTALDRQQEAQAAVTATGGRPVLTPATALRSMAAAFGVKDVEAEIRALEGGAADDQAAAHALLGRLAAAPAAGALPRQPLHPKMLEQRDKRTASAE